MTQPIITNISEAQLRTDTWAFLREPTTLVQICSPGCFHPTYKTEQFVKTHQFKYNPNFSKIDVVENANEGITEELAKEIIQALKDAYDGRHNVVVQCLSGNIRSATLVEFGAMTFGFDFQPGDDFTPAWNDARALQRCWVKHFKKDS